MNSHSMFDTHSQLDKIWAATTMTPTLDEIEAIITFFELECRQCRNASSAFGQWTVFHMKHQIGGLSELCEGFHKDRETALWMWWLGYQEYCRMTKEEKQRALRPHPYRDARTAKAIG